MKEFSSDIVVWIFVMQEHCWAWVVRMQKLCWTWEVRQAYHHCFALAMVELTIANPTGKLSFFNFGFVYLFISFWLLCLSVLGIALFVWLPLGVLCQFKMPFTRNVLAFTLHATS